MKPSERLLMVSAQLQLAYIKSMHKCNAQLLGDVLAEEVRCVIDDAERELSLIERGK